MATAAFMVALLMAIALARGQEIIASDGDVTIVVEEGREVGYKIGEKVVKFSEMPGSWANYTDAGTKGIIDALRLGHGIGTSVANFSSVATEMVTYLKNSVDTRLMTLNDQIIAGNASFNPDVVMLKGTTATLEATKADKTTVSSLDTVVGQVTQGLADANSKSARDLATLQAVDSALTTRMSREEAMSASATAMFASMSTTIATQAAAIVTLNQALTASTSTTTAVSRAVVDQATALAGKLNAKKMMWSGWCSNHGNNGGWVAYCHNTHEFGALESAGYMARVGSSEFRILVAGYYHIGFWCISYGSYIHVQFYVNGNCRHQGHEYSGGPWDDNWAHITWPFNAGDTWYIQVYGSFAYHSGSASGSHSRMQLEYVGAL